MTDVFVTSKSIILLICIAKVLLRQVQGHARPRMSFACLFATDSFPRLSAVDLLSTDSGLSNNCQALALITPLTGG